jgi:predicted DNA-binding transcriptional regulator AlpA
VIVQQICGLFINQMDTKMQPEKLLSKRAVADILDLHPQTIMRLVRLRKFPQPLRTGEIGSSIRWRATDVAGWIEQRTEKQEA